ncbi:MAG: hypothetical protein U0790_05970 [Isosphaeraceae bacterium]
MKYLLVQLVHEGPIKTGLPHQSEGMHVGKRNAGSGTNLRHDACEETAGLSIEPLDHGGVTDTPGMTRPEREVNDVADPHQAEHRSG